MRKSLIIVIMFFNYSEGISQTLSSIDSLYSPSLGRTMRFSITLPSDYDSTNQYPVLYLLHGYGGNYKSWLRTTNIENYADEYPMIVIMPDGEVGSFYVNSYTEPQDRFEDYLVYDLPNFIQPKYATDTTRRSIAGFSMGGYGALVLALKHPDRFWFAASISGAIMIPRDIETLEQIPQYEFAVPGMDKAFGETPNEFRTRHNVFQLYKTTPVEELPYLFLITGIQDGFSEIFTTQKEMADSLRAYGADFEYHEIPGTHNYSRTADAAIQMILQRMKSLREKGFKSLANVLSKTLAEKGMDQAVARFNYFKNNYNDIYYLDQYEMNSLGYELMGKDKIEAAIAVFNLNIESFPKSANAYDSISDAYIKKGEIKLAVEYIEITLKLIPDDPYLSERGKSRLRNVAEEKLEKFKAEGKP